jgi:hypothetical protein
MIDERKIAFDNISRVLAITRYDIEQHQLVNDQSLNIHGENWFRDIFNFVYSYSFKNGNSESKNIAHIDLIDKKRKLAYQITTTKSRKKIDNTLKALLKEEYLDYTIKIFYLLDKAEPSDKISKEIKNEFKDYLGDLNTILLDYRDLLKDIEALETNRLIELNQILFLKTADKYTDNIVLDLIFKHLLQEKKKVRIDFDDDFGTIDTNQKLKLNGINSRTASKINEGLDYRTIIDGYKEEDNLLTDLKDYIIDELYKKILLEALEKKVSKKELIDKKTYELQDIASSHPVNFNKLIAKLHQEIENHIEINDFNSMNIAWIIIAYFFELCDIGVDKKC